jgi:uncharacterized protein (DUF885 family)
MARLSMQVLFAILAVPVVLLATQQGSNPHSSATRDVTGRRQQLQALFKEEWEYELRSDPEMATALGDNRYNDRLGDDSLAFHQADVQQRREFLARFEAIAPAGLPAQEALSRELMIRGLRQDIEGAQFKPWEMPVNQMDGPHLSLIELTTMMPFHTVTDYENYLSRLHQIPRLFEQVTTNMRQGVQDRLMPPRYLLEKVAVETQAVADEKGKSSPFAAPLEKFPASISVAEQDRLRAATVKAINTEIVPAYEKFATFVRVEYAPHGRTEPGVWALPDGEARYRFAIRQMTTTNLSPEQIHEIGLQQITQTEKQMLALAHQLGFQDLAGLNAHIKADRQLYATSGEQLLDLYTKYAHQMEAKLPDYFDHLPTNQLAIVPMDSFRAKNAVPADYSPGAADGSRPGRINVNEWDPSHRLLLNVEAIAYHEGVPGHHLQISLAQELPDLPDFRRNGDYTAFVEGWALYAESLAREMGFYQDPYSEYGRLENEMWRDIRLVVDTGVHEQHWSRDQMVDYFHRYTAMDEPNVQTEVDRYIAWPAQALAYKLGQLEILKLRAEARQKLGNKFDIRAFHDEILGSGPLPLDVLQSRVEAWIAEQGTGQSKQSQ